MSEEEAEMAFTGVGDQYGISSDFQKLREQIFQRELAQAERENKHYFMAIATYKVNPPLTDGTLLDIENFRGEVVVGCYRCETAWSENISKRCKGEPKDDR